MPDNEGSDADNPTTVFYSRAYTAAECEFDTTRKAGWIAHPLSRRPIAGVRLVEPAPLAAAELERAHASAYVRAVRTGEPRELAESSGLMWDPGAWTAACASNGGVVAAVTEAMRTRRNTGSLSSGLHHARAASGAGFCTFNGLALGARAALDAGARRVLIIDLDAHCASARSRSRCASRVHRSAPL
jgi:acetoin utilization deacetylase AcuC-like enzyme